MFIGLMNSIDGILLNYNKRKQQQAENVLGQAARDKAQLLKAKAALEQSKAAHVVDEVARYKDGWVNLSEAQKKLDELSAPGGRLSQAAYEKSGTACAVIKRRMASREGKLIQGASTSLTV